VTGNRLNVTRDDSAGGLTTIDVTRVVSTSGSSATRNNADAPIRGEPPLQHPRGAVANGEGREIGERCGREENSLPCDHTGRYRSYNGWCNNLNNPAYGKSVTPLLRFLSAKYDDGE